MKALSFRLLFPVLCTGLFLGLSLFFSGNFTWVIAVLLIAATLMGSGLSLLLANRFSPSVERANRILSAHSGSLGSNELARVPKALQLLENEVERLQSEIVEHQRGVDAILESLVDGIIAVNEQGKTLFINRAARKILAIDLENVQGKPLTGLVRYEVVQQAARQAIQTGQVVSSEFRTYDSPPKQVRLRVTPTSGIGQPGLTLLFHDFTELKKLETIRRDFVANVSHELKTPLATIKGYAETLLMGAVDRQPENRLFLERINKQADLLNQQIQDLLQLARVESGREVFKFEAINLVQLCQELIGLLQDEASSKGVALSIQAPETNQDLCFAWGDSEGMRTIVSNLISNAVRYTHIAGSDRAGKVLVTIQADEVNVWIEVIDNGVGIAKEHQQRIFERFFRVDPARSRDQGGTGLGLSIVKHLVQSFQGQIELESKPGKGSVFRTVFPLFIK